MNLYLISQETNSKYDTYDSAVVVAESAEQARTIFPESGFDYDNSWNEWVPMYDVKVKLIGEATPEYDTPGVTICASFRAG